MKSKILVMILILMISKLYAYQFIIRGVQAKKIYNILTGSFIQEDAAMSHLYRKGHNLVCQYTSADITQHGINIPPYHSSRYRCAMEINSNGFIKPTTI